MPLDIAIEGVLFYKASALRKTDLLKLFSCSDTELAEALSILNERLIHGAMRLVETDKEVQLVTAPELDDFIEGLRKEELKRDIGKAGAETLAIILYKAPVTRAEIDRIRGVNSAFILRNLMVRGLVERNPEGRTNTFSPTAELYAHLGITDKFALPDYEVVVSQITQFEAAQQAESAE